LTDPRPGKIIPFLEEIKQKADGIGWNVTLTVNSNQHPVTPPNMGLLLHHHYWMLTIQNVKSHALVYIGTQSWDAQALHMMYKFLQKLLTNGARASMANEHEEFTLLHQGNSSHQVLCFMLRPRQQTFTFIRNCAD
jgi:hypothetical protein